MTHDPYLDPVLELAKDDELMVLVKMILDRFSNLLETDENYKKNPDRPHTYIKALAKEFREMGGNSFANTWRGEGPAYSEIVCDVADEIGVKYSKDDRVDEIETRIREKVLDKALAEMTTEEKENLMKELATSDINIGASALTAQIIFRTCKFASYKWSLVLVNRMSQMLVGRGLSIAANAGFAKLLSVAAGPVGIALTTIWTLLDIAGPATKVTVPGVVYIGALRELQNNRY